MICPCCNRPRKNWITTPLGRACKLCMVRYATANVIVQLHGETILRRYVERNTSRRALKKLGLVSYILGRWCAERRTKQDLSGRAPIAEQAVARGLPVPVGLTAKEIRERGFEIAADVGPDEVLVRDASMETGYAWSPDEGYSELLFGKTCEEVKSLGFKVPGRVAKDSVFTVIGFVGKDWVDFLRDEIAEGRGLDSTDTRIAESLQLVPTHFFVSFR